MELSKIRNIAIIAHVDHGKTTLVDQLFRQSGLFRDNQVVQERMMDSMDQERERGITIMAKNGAFLYKDYLINIIDTPGHADFGGQVECVLKMSDGVLLLVDAAEGPMPQTYFVLKKALNQSLPVMVVINKIDKPSARCDEVVNEVFDLMVRLEAPDHILDFPIIYASARDGFAVNDYKEQGKNMEPLFEKIINCMPAPKLDRSGHTQMLVSLLSYSSFLGRLAVGKIFSGTIKTNQDVVVTRDGVNLKKSRITKLYEFHGNEMQPIEEASAGEIVAVAGIEDIVLGETIADPEHPIPVSSPDIDPPTISMHFLPNDSPFSGREGKFVNSRHLKERLYKEALSDVALKIEPLQTEVGYCVYGRGELHLSVLIEKMRREGYEFQVTKPKVIFKEVDGKRMEPYEELTLDITEDSMGKIMELLGERKGALLDMHKGNDMLRLKYKITTRGLLGFKTDFMTQTRGMGTMNYIFWGYDTYLGEMKGRKNGVLIVMETGVTTPYALFGLQDRGRLILDPVEKVYKGQIVGEHTRDNDLVVNATREKKLTNMRAAGSDDATILIPAWKMSLEECLSFINDDELVEVTPQSIRLRKKLLDETARKQASRSGN